MAQIHWLNPVSGDFATAADWSGGAVPGSGDDVALGALGGAPYTVTSSANEHIASLQTAANATLDISDGFFQVDNGTGAGANAGIIIDAGVLELGGALRNSGTIELDENGAGEILLTSATTLSGGGSIAFNGGDTRGEQGRRAGESQRRSKWGDRYYPRRPEQRRWSHY